MNGAYTCFGVITKGVETLGVKIWRAILIGFKIEGFADNQNKHQIIAENARAAKHTFGLNGTKFCKHFTNMVEIFLANGQSWITFSSISVSCAIKRLHPTIISMKFGWVHTLVLVTLLTFAGNANAANKCKLALVLAIDVSGSVNWAEYRLQMNGLTAALSSPEIAHAIRFPGDKGIMATVVQWSGDPHQFQIVPWEFLSDEQSIEDFTAKVQNTVRSFVNFSTALGNAVWFSAGLFGRLPMDCPRKVIDVSGDGRNNEGIDISEIRDAVVASGITINGLAIIGPDPGLPEYYRKHVIGGPNAFVIPAKTFKDYPEAIRRKLLREIVPPLAFAQ